MKVFIWHNVEVTENYHSGGGLVVIANDEKEARDSANKVIGVNLLAEEAPDVIEYLLKDSTKPVVYIHPDAGCC